jgi:hypothetical protein
MTSRGHEVGQPALEVGEGGHVFEASVGEGRALEALRVPGNCN